MRVVLVAGILMVTSALVAVGAAPSQTDAGAAPLDAATAVDEADAPFAIASPAFADGDTIPAGHTCDGAGTSPALMITGIPAAAATVALVMHDPDAPFPVVAFIDYTHWTVWDVPLNGRLAARFTEGAAPHGATEGANSGGGTGWTPPCPPPGSPPHRYLFVAHALDAPLGLADGASRADVDAAIAANSIAEATLKGCYARVVPVVLGC